MKAVPTRFMSAGRRVFKSLAGKIFVRHPGGGRTYRPKVSHITHGTRTFAIKKHHSVYYGGKPKRLTKSSYGMMRNVFRFK